MIEKRVTIIKIIITFLNVWILIHAQIYIYDKKVKKNIQMQNLVALFLKDLLLMI
jgi:hypothetical protein